MAEQRIRAGLVVTIRLANGPRVDPGEVAELLLVELPARLWIGDSLYAVDYELDVDAITKGTTRVDL
jgi:hypothetical protein